MRTRTSKYDNWHNDKNWNNKNWNNKKVVVVRPYIKAEGERL